MEDPVPDVAEAGASDAEAPAAVDPSAPENNPPPPPDAGDKPPEYHLVESCRSVKGDSAWVQWLGYPKGRNCWRSVGSHFPLLEGGSEVLATHSRLKMTVRPETAEESAAADAAGTVLQGRKPPGGDIRTAPAPLRPPPTERAEPAAKKARKEFESKVHTIRVDDVGVHEIRGVRRDGESQVETKTLISFSSAPGASGAVGASGASGASGAAGPSGASSSSSGGESSQHAGSSSSSSDAKPVLGGDGGLGEGGRKANTGADERSELWRAHRMINGDALRKRKGFTFRIEVTDTTNSHVSLKWVFPESSPGDASAWIGLWDADGARAPVVGLGQPRAPRCAA